MSTNPAVQRAWASPTSWYILCTPTNNFSFYHLLNDHIVSNLLDNNEKTKMPLTVNFVFFTFNINLVFYLFLKKEKDQETPTC